MATCAPVALRLPSPPVAHPAAAARRRRLVAGQVLGVGCVAVAAWQVAGGWYALAVFGAGLFSVCQFVGAHLDAGR